MADITTNDPPGHQFVGEEARARLEAMRVFVVGKPSKSLLDFVLVGMGMGVCVFAPLPLSVIGVVALLLVVVRR
jgi:hypothetical protein